jgi:hypothetical protein
VSVLTPFQAGRLPARAAGHVRAQVWISPFIFDGTKSYFLKIPEEFHVEDPSALNDREAVVGTIVHHRTYYYHDGQTMLLPQPGDQFTTPYYSMSGVDINNQGKILVNYAYDRLGSYIYRDGEHPGCRMSASWASISTSVAGSWAGRACTRDGRSC